MLEKHLAVYIPASQRKGTLYTGVTGNLIQRIYQHKHPLVEGFTKKYRVHFLMYYEIHQTMETAIIREKQIKKWKRQWKLVLIEKENPHWKGLYENII